MAIYIIVLLDRLIVAMEFINRHNRGQLGMSMAADRQPTALVGPNRPFSIFPDLLY